MRTTTLALLGAALVACVDVSHKHYTYDGGGGDGAARQCDTAQLVVADQMTFSFADATDALPGVPSSGSWKLSGTLVLDGSGVTSVAKLGDLCSVGSLQISRTGLTKVDTAAPIEVVGDVLIDTNDSLTDVTNLVPGADRIGSLVVQHNELLAKLDSFAPVKYVSGATTIVDNAALVDVDLHSALRLEGGLYVMNDGALTSLELGALQSTGDLELASDAKLATVALGPLQYVHGSLTIDSDPLLDLGTMMAAPLMHVDFNMTITNDAALTNLGKLAYTGGVGGVIDFANDAQLDYCTAREVGCCVAHTGLEQLANLATASCNTGAHSWCYAQNNNNCPYQY